MKKIYVYLGSDHVIQQPCFDVREEKLRLSTSRAAAIHQACQNDAAGVLNMYALDLDKLRVKATEDSGNAVDHYDVVRSSESDIAICSEAALQSLVFTGASFVSQ